MDRPIVEALQNLASKVRPVDASRVSTQRHSRSRSMSRQDLGSLLRASNRLEVRVGAAGSRTRTWRTNVHVRL